MSEGTMDKNVLMAENTWLMVENAKLRDENTKLRDRLAYYKTVLTWIERNYNSPEVLKIVGAALEVSNE